MIAPQQQPPAPQQPATRGPRAAPAAGVPGQARPAASATRERAATSAAASPVADDRLAALLSRAILQRCGTGATATAPGSEKGKTILPLTSELGYEHNQAAREGLGEAAFQTLLGWRLDDLAAILDVVDVARRRTLIRTLAETHGASRSDHVGAMLAHLGVPLGLEATVALAPARAAFVLGHPAQHAAYVRGVLTAAGEDVARASAAMGLLAPLLNHPVRLAMARGVLDERGFDAAVAAPIVAYLLRYAGDATALLAAHQEYASAGGDIAAAGRSMDVLARYNYDRHLRDLADTRAATVAATEHARAISAAAAARRLDDLAAETAAGAEYARHKPKGERPAEPASAKKATKAKLEGIRKWDKADADALTKADKVRQAELVRAGETEQTALIAATAARPGVRDAALVRIDAFVARATASIGAADATFVGKTSGLDLPLAEALLGVLSDHGSVTGRSVATWLARFAGDMVELARARSFATAALRAGIALPLATEVAELLLETALADGHRDTLIAAIAASTGDFEDVCTLLRTCYPKRRDQAATALQGARANAVPVSLLISFGAGAHVFIAAVPAAPALLVARGPWLLKLLAQTDRGIAELCEFAREMRALPDDKAELLIDACATSIDGLRAKDMAAYNALVAAAQAIAVDELAAEAHWYWLWRVKLDQPLASINGTIAGLPDVGERTTLAPALASAPLRAALIAAKGAGAPLRWAKILKIVAMAGPGQYASLGSALAAIAATYAPATDELLDLLVSNHVSGVPQTILYAKAQGAPKGFIVWQHGPNTSQDNFRAHENGWWEYLAGVGAGLVASRTIDVQTQKLTGTSGGTTDCLHVFDITFTLTPAAGGGTVLAELHNHVNTVSKSQTSLHFKYTDKGREISSASSISADCRNAVIAVPPTRHFAGGYTNRFPTGYTL